MAIFIALMGLYCGERTIKTADRSAHQRFFERFTGISYQIAGIKIITTIGDDIELADEFASIFLGQSIIKNFYIHIGVDADNRLFGALDLFHPRAMCHG